jgi:hypothetical protein
MFIGHFGVALAAKRAAPLTSLGTLVAAAQLLDLVWPLLLLAGVEQVRVVPGGPPFEKLDFVRYPVTHSLATVLAGAALFGAVYLWRTGYRAGAWTVAACVLSHWVLDLVVHVPDLPVWPGGPKVGLGLWNAAPAAVAVEAAIFGGGAALYLSTTRARDAAGRFGLVALLVFLAVLYVGAVVGPSAPSPSAVAVSALAIWLFVPWAAWVDRHRGLRAAGLRRPAAA